jgi:hypothetical protein
MAETTYETIRMTDGRVVDFPGKTRLMKEAYADDAGRLCVRLDFRNGEARVFAMREDMITKFALHGAEQKLGDEIAGIKELDDAVLAIEDLIDRLAAGEWNQRREASGMAGTSVLARAMVEATGKDMETIKTFLKTKTHAEKLALRASSRIKPIVDRLEAEKAAKSASVDTEALLAELD